jgi:hypothetical protein
MIDRFFYKLIIIKQNKQNKKQNKKEYDKKISDIANDLASYITDLNNTKKQGQREIKKEDILEAQISIADYTTPLYWAVYKNNLLIFDFLIRNGAKYNHGELTDYIKKKKDVDLTEYTQILEAKEAKVREEARVRAEAEQREAQAIANKAEEARVTAQKEEEAARVTAQKEEATRVRAEEEEATRVRAEEEEATRVRADKAEEARLKAEEEEATRVRAIADKAEEARLKAEEEEATRLKAEEKTRQQAIADKADEEAEAAIEEKTRQQAIAEAAIELNKLNEELNKLNEIIKKSDTNEDLDNIRNIWRAINLELWQMNINEHKELFNLFNKVKQKVEAAERGIFEIQYRIKEERQQREADEKKKEKQIKEDIMGLEVINEPLLLLAPVTTSLLLLAPVTPVTPVAPVAQTLQEEQQQKEGEEKPKTAEGEEKPKTAEDKNIYNQSFEEYKKGLNLNKSSEIVSTILLQINNSQTVKEFIKNFINETFTKLDDIVLKFHTHIKNSKDTNIISIFASDILKLYTFIKNYPDFLIKKHLLIKYFNEKLDRSSDGKDTKIEITQITTNAAILEEESNIRIDIKRKADEKATRVKAASRNEGEAAEQKDKIKAAPLSNEMLIYDDIIKRVKNESAILLKRSSDAVAPVAPAGQREEILNAKKYSEADIDSKYIPLNEYDTTNKYNVYGYLDFLYNIKEKERTLLRKFLITNIDRIVSVRKSMWIKDTDTIEVIRKQTTHLENLLNLGNNVLLKSYRTGEVVIYYNKAISEDYIKSINNNDITQNEASNIIKNLIEKYKKEFTQGIELKNKMIHIKDNETYFDNMITSISLKNNNNKHSIEILKNKKLKISQLASNRDEVIATSTPQSAQAEPTTPPPVAQAAPSTPQVAPSTPTEEASSAQRQVAKTSRSIQKHPGTSDADTAEEDSSDADSSDADTAEEDSSDADSSDADTAEEDSSDADSSDADTAEEEEEEETRVTNIDSQLNDLSQKMIIQKDFIENIKKQGNSINEIYNNSLRIVDNAQKYKYLTQNYSIINQAYLGIKDIIKDTLDNNNILLNITKTNKNILLDEESIRNKIKEIAGQIKLNAQGFELILSNVNKINSIISEHLNEEDTPIDTISPSEIEEMKEKIALLRSS